MVGEFRLLIEASRTNFCRLVVDAVEERMRVEGFHTRESTNRDAAAWDIWQANQMDVQSNVAFIEALVKGTSYLSVWDDQDGDGYPDISIEDPMECIVAYEPGSNYRRRQAALKIYRDDWSGVEKAVVFLPDSVHTFLRKGDPDATIGTEESRALQAVSTGDWLPTGVVANELGVVPIIPLRNRPRLLMEGESELSDVMNVQDQINGLTFLMALAGYFGAHRQRWASGVPIMLDTKGDPIEPFVADVTRLWVSENPDAKFGDFEATDLVPYIKAIEQKVLHIAVTTRTPRHYLIEQGQSPSGDAIKSAEAGLTQKVARKQRPFGEALEEVMKLARMVQGSGSATDPGSEVVWASAEIRTEAEITDAAVKKVQAGLISKAQALEDMGYTPQQIEQIMAAAEAEAQQKREQDLEQAKALAALRPDPAGPPTA